MTDPDPLSQSSMDRDQNATLQRVIDALVADGPQYTVAELVDRLATALHKHGLPPMPEPWVQAVAEAAAVGNPYVVSRVTAHHQHIPAPATPDHPYDIT